ncbi:hypothetical protein V5O48_004630 [Marasmius crinis-equi]|uniref:Cytochrome P450 n=1 Tax=Marasmius crinis-equi TaxID=585013 RepID=A0ABR3FQJ8_9AGAR
MPLKLTPGVKYIASLLKYFIVPPVAVLLASRGIGTLQQLPPSFYVALTVFGAPSFFVARSWCRQAYYQRRAASMGARLPPKVKGRWPGNLDVALELGEALEKGYPGDGFEHGNIYDLWLTWENVFITSCPEHIQQILATDFSNYLKGEGIRINFEALLGVGVFTSDGEMWKFHRQMTRPFFTRDRISHFDLFDRHAEIAITQVKNRMQAGYPIDFQDLMSRFTLDSATEFLFGSCTHSLTTGRIPYPYYADVESFKGDNAIENFVAAFTRALEVIAMRQYLGHTVWPFLEIFEDKSEAPMKIVNGFIEPIVKKALEKQKKVGGVVAVKETIGDEETLLDHLVCVTDDPVVIKDEILNLLIAGRDTTAATLTFSVYFLATYPEVMRRLREEILSRVGPTRRPTYEDIKEMKYLRAVINETLRLYPPVPFNTRTNIRGVLWPSPDPNDKPLYIPPESETSYSVFLMHRRKDLWGPDADEFDPDRFLDDRHKTYLLPNPFIFLPFNAGPRICLGQQFAYNEVSFMLVKLLQNFSSFSYHPDAAPRDLRRPEEWNGAPGRKGVDTFYPQMNMTMNCKGGLWVRAKEVEDL